MSTPAGEAIGQAFDIVADRHCRVLILGSFPGAQSLRDRQYYANPRNHFWHLMTRITGTDLVSLSYPYRLATLLAHRIGLWDVVATARRAGSLDTALRDIAPRKLSEIAETLPDLRAMAFNGAAAFRIGQRQMAQHPAIACLLLPSSSPAYTIGLAAKAEAWRCVIPYL